MKIIPLLSIIFTCCLLIVSCKEENDSPDVAESYRLKAWYDTVYNYKYEIIYEGDKVSEVQFSIDDVVITRHIWTYEDNTITIRTHSRRDSVWRPTENYRRLTYDDNNKLIESYNHSESIPYSVYKYTWQGDKVISEDIFVLGTKSTFTFSYENELITQVTGTQEGTDYLAYETLKYKSGKISEMTFWCTDTVNKVNFFYEGDMLDRIEKRHGNSSSDNVTIEDYTFDSNHNLSQKVRYSDGPSPYLLPIFVEYEPGKGNFDQHWLVRYGWLAVYLYPNMIPSRDAHGSLAPYGEEGVLQY